MTVKDLEVERFALKKFLFVRSFSKKLYFFGARSIRRMIDLDYYY